MVDKIAIQWWIEKGLPERGIDVEAILQAVGLASSLENVDVPLKTADILRAIQREQKLLTNYRDRKQYPHLRGGRPKRVNYYTFLAETMPKEQVLRIAAKELSRRSIFRLKKALGV